VALNNFLFTSESVSEGHPDKVADQISDAVLDAYLAQDPRSRVACETLVKSDNVVVAGEITSKGSVNFDDLVRGVLSEIGYDDPSIGFDAQTVKLITLLTRQSPDISMGVDSDNEKQKEQGAGDQGLMFGFACDETPELMPLPISMAHQLMKRLSYLRKEEKVKFLKPDAKSQVTVEYRDGKPQRVHTVVLSTQHSDDISLKDLERYVIDNVVKKIVPDRFLDKETRYFINPTGRFVIGGPVGDAGLTGRKIIVDTYGGYGRHGGGAFSGKDPSKVDRSAAYAARHIAKNIVASGVAKKCEVQVAYAIGVARPVAIYVDTFGTSKVAEEKIGAAVSELFDLRPQGIIQSLDMLKPIYRVTTNYGHFGREPTGKGEFSWERTDKVDALKSALR
jgi:S-adenosylmethionine synthetase